MSIPKRFGNEKRDRSVTEGIFQDAVFSAFYNLVCERRAEGMTKAEVAERMGADKATVTKLTSGSTNMKIKTAANLANALDADLLVLIVDRNKPRVFSPIGIHASTFVPQNVASSSTINHISNSPQTSETGAAIFAHSKAGDAEIPSVAGPS